MSKRNSRTVPKKARLGPAPREPKVRRLGASPWDGSAFRRVPDGPKTGLRTGAGPGGARAKTILYFAYGSNMRRDQMSRRCPGARLAGIALVRHHRFAISTRGYATILPHPTGVVHGVLWRLTLRHEQALDRYESVHLDHYRKVWISVRSKNQQARRTLVYIASDPAPGRPRRAYLAGILQAARGHKFPASYIAQLERWQPGQRNGKGNRAERANKGPWR